MPLDMESFKKQLVNKYNEIKRNLIVVLNTSDNGNKDKKSEDLNTKGKPLKNVLMKMGVSETDLRNALRNSNIEIKIDIYPVALENDKEEQWIKISDKL